mgnify:CR=1 FL=1
MQNQKANNVKPCCEVKPKVTEIDGDIRCQSNSFLSSFNLTNNIFT